MKGFGLDGKLFRGLSKAGDFLILALITVICCIPVITIGASLTAAFYSGMRLVKGIMYTRISLSHLRLISFRDLSWRLCLQ